MQKIAEFIERDINNPEIQVRSINDRIILEGQAGSEDEKAKAVVIAKTYMPNFIKEAGDDSIRTKLKNDKEPIVDLLTVKALPPPPPGKIIKLVIHYVELNKDYTNGFRFQWTPDLKDGSSVNFTADARNPSNIVSTISGTISNLLPKLNSAKQHGHARVLQSSSLIVLDGKSGTLNNVSQVPFQTISASGTPVTQFAPAGLQTTISPVIQGARSDSVLLTLAFKVSALVGTTNAGPLITESQINTDIIVRSGQSAAIGGLISNDEGTAYNKLPPETSSNPIFSLYASKDFRRKQSQFVVFVTPIIMTSASAGADKIKEKFRLNQ
jgi:pilus assembly protein CpaC